MKLMGNLDRGPDAIAPNCAGLPLFYQPLATYQDCSVGTKDRLILLHPSCYWPEAPP